MLILFGLAFPTESLAADTAKDIAFFERKIRPVLIKNCYECHSAEAVKSGELAGGLQLDTRAGSRQGGDSGPAVAPGKPEQSLLLAALRHEGELEMPPDDKLAPAVTNRAPLRQARSTTKTSSLPISSDLRVDSCRSARNLAASPIRK